MKIKYLGPHDKVNVAGAGVHHKGQVKDYPDHTAEDLLATSVKQQFEIVEAGEEKPKEKKKG